MSIQLFYPPQRLALAIALALGCTGVSMAQQPTEDTVAPASEATVEKQTRPRNKAPRRPPTTTTMEGEWSRTTSFSKGEVEAGSQFRNLGQIGAEVHVAGEFHNEGGVGRTVFVRETGKFSGNGTVQALNVKGQWEVDLGRGAPVIKKNLELAQSATLLYGIRPDGGSATVKVGGTATLGNATLKIVSIPGEYITTSTHVVIDAKKVNGKFGEVVNELRFMDAQAHYSPTQVGLTYVRNNISLEEAAASENGREFAANVQEPQPVESSSQKPIEVPLIAQAPTATPDASSQTRKPDTVPQTTSPTAIPAALVQTASPEPKPNAAINALLGTSMATAADAIDQLSGYATADLGNATLSSVAPISAGMLAAMYEKNHGNRAIDGQVWVQAIGNSGSVGRQLGSDALKHSTYGLMLGTDWAVSPDWRLGVIGSKTQTRLDSDRLDGQLDSWHVGAYALRQDGPLALRLGAIYGNHDGSTKRHVAFNDFRNRLNGRYDANTQQVFGEVGYDLDVTRFDVHPYANVGYQRYQRNGYTEKGGDAALKVHGQTQDYYNSNLGLRLSRAISFDQGMRLIPRVDVGWKHIYGDVRGSSRQRLVSGGNTYTVEGADLDRDGLLLEAGLDLAVSPRHTLGVSYSDETGSDNRNRALMGQWRMMF